MSTQACIQTGPPEPRVSDLGRSTWVTRSIQMGRTVAEKSSMKLFNTFPQRDRGATMVEYSLLVAVISMISFSAVTLVGDSTEDAFTEAAAGLDHVSGGGGSVESNAGDPSDGAGGDGGTATTTTTTPPSPTTTQPPPTTTTTQAPTFDAETDLTVEGATSELTSWQTTKKGGKGDWKASFGYSNDWGSDQYLTFEVTYVDHKGKTTSGTVTDFLVPTGGSSTFDVEGNIFQGDQRHDSGCC